MKKAKRIWQDKPNGINPKVAAYTVGDDFVYDNILLPYDIEGTRAHVKMLEKIKVLTKKELTDILKGLTKIEAAHRGGKLKTSQELEDCHTVIENELVRYCGQTGKKVHTGRSRNDQVATAMRLYERDQMDHVMSLIEDIGLLQAPFTLSSHIMPGYTHTQPAMMTTVSEWYKQFEESFKDDGMFCVYAASYTNKNPLGSGAGYGVPWKLNREMTTQELGFYKTIDNNQYCQLSRYKTDEMVLFALSRIMNTCSQFANDMMLYTSDTFKFFSLPKAFTTGSSIMPHKKNYDLFEIMRMNAAKVQGSLSQMQLMNKNLLTGYNRDVQGLKKIIMDAFMLTITTLELMKELLPEVEIHEENIDMHITDDLLSVEEVHKIMKKTDKPFREAYHEYKKGIK